MTHTYLTTTSGSSGSGHDSLDVVHETIPSSYIHTTVAVGHRDTPGVRDRG